MKRFCILLTAFVLLLAMSSCALAAAPSFSMKVSAVTAGDEAAVTINAKAAGFISLRLLNESGYEVLTPATNLEVHTKNNEVTFKTVDESGAPLSAGTYTIEGVLVDQFDVSSKTVTTTLTIEEPEVVEPKAKEEEKKPTSSGKKEDSSIELTSDELTYAAGECVVGEEGYQIGVGPSDVAEQENAGYWGLTSESSDEEIWAAITSPFISVNVDETEVSYIYDSTDDDRKKLGSVSGLSQGINVIAERKDGWSLVEAYRNEDGAFVRGYIRSNRLRKVTVNSSYGIVIDKKAQTLIVFKDGKRIGSCKVTTGLPTPKYPHRESPAGDFITVTRRGSYDYYGLGFTKYTIRINNNYYIAEIPTTKREGTNFSLIEQYLGEKSTRGTICIAHDASTDGGINAEWIWNMTTENKKVRVLIFDDKDRSMVPVKAD